MKFLPEGLICESEENKRYFESLNTLYEAMAASRTLEARALVCEGNHNLIVDLGVIKGVIPREEAAIGIAEGTTRDIAIISRVNKPVCFKITAFERDCYGKTVAILSRRKAQIECREQFLSKLRPGDIIPARITHLEQFGAFVDVGCGIVSLIPIDMISVSRISHPKDRFSVGQNIKAVVKSIEGSRISLTHKELLGTWEENVSQFKPGETVSGVIRSVEDYGVFVELTPNLAGLAELKPGVCPGQQASVYIKSMIPDKMKVKLIIVDAFEEDTPPPPLRYYIDRGHLSHWVYSPQQSEKLIETVFDE